MAKSKKKRVKKYNAKAQIIKKLTGLASESEIPDPLCDKPEILNTVHSHPRVYAAHKLNEMAQSAYEVCDSIELVWRVSVRVEFKDGSGKVYFREAEICFQGFLPAIHEHFNRMVEDIFSSSNMSQYATTYMKSEILGSKWSAAKFDISKEEAA